MQSDCALHLDSDWTVNLARFRFVAQREVHLGSDGSTNIFKGQRGTWGHMCIMGDVPPAMFALSTPDEVYNYSIKLIKEIGPEGFILHSGCDIPVQRQIRECPGDGRLQLPDRKNPVILIPSSKLKSALGNLLLPFNHQINRTPQSFLPLRKITILQNEIPAILSFQTLEKCFNLILIY